MNEAIDNAKEAIEFWLETVIDDGGKVPEASDIETHRIKREFKGWIWAIVEVDLRFCLGMNPTSTRRSRVV